VGAVWNGRRRRWLRNDGTGILQRAHRPHRLRQPRHRNGLQGARRHAMPLYLHLLVGLHRRKESRAELKMIPGVSRRHHLHLAQP